MLSMLSFWAPIEYVNREFQISGPNIRLAGVQPVVSWTAVR